MKKVLIVGDSRKMKGGVSSVIKIMESSPLWSKYDCYWVQCQINESYWKKLLYIVSGTFIGCWKIPKYDIIHFHTTPRGIRRLSFLFFFSIFCHKCIIFHIHIGNELENYKNNPFFLLCCKKASKIVVLGKMLIRYIPENYRDKCYVLYNPANNVIPSNNSNKYFLFAAYLNNKCKDYVTLLEGFKKFVKIHPDWKLVICGTGEIENVYQIIRKNHLEHHVECPGWVVGKEKEVFFRNSYAYIMTSTMEGLPMSVIEAMSYGKPIISTPVGCLPEFLSNNQSALFFNFHNSDDLACCLCRIVENRELYDTLVNNGKDIIHNFFRRDIFLERLENMYQSV